MWRSSSGTPWGGEIGDDYNLRVALPDLRATMDATPDFAHLPTAQRIAILESWEARVKAKLPPITEDSMPGELSNVVAGRVANALDLGGPNFTTDAACASSMAAMQAAVKGLRDGDFDLALTGGADRTMGVATYVKFCKIGALSADGSRPFDAGANGFVMGEGCGILVLKRLSAAERDGDRIYAVIRGIGASSDGRGKGITAPNPVGQLRALRRAYEAARLDPADVDLFECHGTSTVVGDKVEVEALSEVIGARGRARGPVRIGSIKSNLGHLKSAAGAASALKAVLAVHHGVLAPQINYRTPRADLDVDRVPLRVQTTPEAWENRRRLAGVSSFGFGGTNFHLVVEGWRPGMDRGRPARRRDAAEHGTTVEPLRQRKVPVEPASYVAPPAPARTHPAFAPPTGIWALSADTPEELIARCRALARGQVSPFEPDAAFRVAAAATHEAERNEQLERVIATVQKGKGHELLRQRGIAYEDVPCDGHLALLFTGQGSQYVGMGLELAAHFPVVADTFREADEVMTPLLGRPLTDYLRRDPSQTEEAQFEALRQTEISQPATLAVDVAIVRLLAAYGVRPEMVAGHSLGEYGAAVAAGMLSFRDALQAVSARGREMAAVQIDDKGRMAGIATSAETVAEVLAEIPGYVVAANKNCPTQTVIAGETEAVEAACEAFRSRGITVYPLPVSHAFHSRIVAPASAPLRKVLAGLDLRAPRRRITTNVDSRWYPTGPEAREAVLDILARQVASPVEWIDQMERMYGEGARVFVECGPKRALAGFTTAIFKHRPHRSLYTNQPKRGDVQSFLDALAALLALGFPVEAGTSAGADRGVDLFAAGGARRSTTPLLKGRAEARANALAQPLPSVETRGTPAIEREIRVVVAQKTGWTPDTLDLDFDLESDLGIDTVKLADIVATVRERLQLPPDPDFRMGDHRTLRSLIDYAGARTGATRPSVLSDRRPVHEDSPEHAGAQLLDADVAARFLAEIATKDLRGLDAGTFASAMLPALQGFLAAAHAAWSAAQPRDVRTTVVRELEARSAPSVVSREFSGGGALPRNAPPGGVAPWTPLSSTTGSRLRIACAGASLGLPGGESVFSSDNIARILRGENRIGPVGAAMVAAQLAQNVVRVTKDASTGQGDFARVETPDQVIRLAGRKAAFDPAEWGMDEDLVRSLDITTQLAMAAGYEALRDAGIPLVRTYRTTTSGKSVATGWALPEGLRDDTGIILASAFAGYDQLLGHLARAQDPSTTFDRRFLFQVLAMGHAQFAQAIGARGPNTGINAACASTTQALALAEDWIRLGRARRVIVLGADDVTNDRLFPWIGTGFLAAGAASTKENVEEAALPFDRRRHGMIAGMGAVALVLEPLADVEARGMAPVAELLGTRIANSAFHGTRLDAAHIASHVASFVGEACAAAGVDRETFARRSMFMSHETYTPARGGSAAAEMASLPAAFGAASRHVWIANTKGFTGHAMGAGIEDAVAVKALQYRRVPPIANLREPDPDLGELHLSEGGHADIDYALRLAAGFGSQLALAAWRRAASGDTRVVAEGVYQSWLEVTCGGAGQLEVASRQLRYLPGGEGRANVSLVGLTQPGLAPHADGIVTQEAHVLPKVLSASGSGTNVSHNVSRSVAPVRENVLGVLLGVIAAKTGYGVDELDPSFALEADLGVDTVKQAEIFGEVRERFSLPRDDSFRLADYPTIQSLAGWLQGQVAGPSQEERLPHRPSDAGHREDRAVPFPSSSLHAPVAVGTVAVAPASVVGATGAAEGEVLDVLLAVIAAKTGYDRDELDLSFALEADLGIDTVKQAEIFGEVRERFSLPRDDSFRLADYPTIQALAGWLQGQVAGSSQEERLPQRPSGAGPRKDPAVPSPSSPLHAPVAVGTVAVAPVAVEGEVLAVLLAVIAAKTGYDLDELDPTFALEADLGIDTVKQAEIFGEVRDRFSLPRDDSFRLADHPTILSLAGWLEVQVARGAAPAGSGTPESPKGSPLPQRHADAETERNAADGVPQPVSLASLAPDSMSTPVVSLPESAGPSDEVAVATSPSKDAAPDVVAPSPSPAVDTTAGETALFHVEQRVTAPWIAPGALAAATAAPAPALVAASALLPASFRMREVTWVRRTPSAWPRFDGQSVKVLGDGALADALRGLLATLGADGGDHPDVVVDCGAPVLEGFAVAKALDAQPPAQWLSVEHGDFASAREARDAGARAGLAKALGREWGGCRARVVSLDASLDAETAVEVLLRELSEVDEAAEVRLGGDVREVAVLSTRVFPAAGRLVVAGGRAPVVLLTGGTRGITARVAQALAEAGPCTLVLVGRTGPGLAPLDEAAAKRQARARLEAGGERVVPRHIEEILAPLRVAEEVRRTVAVLRAAGATVEVQTVDMADEGAVRGLVAQVLRQHGHLDLCVHGAGVEESRLLSDKDARAFQRVYEAKAVGGLALAEALPEGTLLVSMGSIAGRLGNAGQVDYAAANEAMARVCRARPRSLHVAWTAWGDTGMAVRGGMEALLTGRGVDLLPAAAGAALVRDMVAAMDGGALSGEVLVAGALGDFTLPPLHALADVLELEGDTAVFRRELSLDTDPWLGDHAIGGVPVLPGVIGMELMVAAALAAHPEGTYCGVEDVRFEAPLKLHRDSPVHIEVRATPEGDGSVRCSLRSRRRARTGRELETEHFSARVQLDGMPLLPRIRPAVLPEEILAQRDIYLRFFHGPRFQVLEGVEAIGLDGLLGQASVSHAPIAEGLLSDPLVLEAAFQAAGLHRMVVEGILALPASIDAVERVRPVVDGDLLTVTVQRRDGGVYDIDVDAEDGRVMTVRGFRMSDLGPLPERDRFPEPEGGRGVDAIGTSDGRTEKGGDRSSGDETEAGGTSSAVQVPQAAPGAPLLVTASATADEARGELPGDEVAWLTARGTPARQADRLAGQLAARRAVAELAGGRTFTVARLASGAPVVEGLGEDVRVSISHQEGRAVAIAARGGVGLGVDLETIAARDPAFARTWFTEGEQARWGGDPANATRVWALKEAVLKALGRGMALSPREVEVCELVGSGGGVAEEGGPSSAPSSRRSRNARLHLHGDVARELAAAGNPEIRAEVADLDDVRVLATVVLAA